MYFNILSALGFSPLNKFTISKLWRIQIWPSINNDCKISRFKLHFSSITNNKYRGSHYIKNNGVDMRKCDATKKRSIGWNEKIDRWLSAGILQRVLFLCNDQWLLKATRLKIRLVINRDNINQEWYMYLSQNM